MLLAKLLKQLTRLRLQPKVGWLHALLLRRTRGMMRRSWLLAGGQPILALTTTGRRSGQLRTTAVAYVPHGQGYAVAALNLGSDRHPAWCLNLRADPRATVSAAGKQLRVRAREAAGPEADELWQRFQAQLSQVRNTRAVAARDVPVIVLEPAGDPK